MKNNEIIDELRNALTLLHNRLWFLRYHQRFLEYPRWRDTVNEIIRSRFGEQSDEYQTFNTVSNPEHWFEYRPTVTDELFREKVHKRHYQDHLKKVDDTLERIILKYQIKRPSNIQRVIIKRGRITGAWIKAHKIWSSIIGASIVIITLLGTNWSLVAENFTRFLDFFCSPRNG